MSSMSIVFRMRPLANYKLTIKILLLIILSFYSSISFAQDINNNKDRKVIMLIGDGMGLGQLALLDSAWGYGRLKGLVPDRESSYSELIKSGTISLISTKPASYIVQDSACASSSISSGKNCIPETLGFDEKGTGVEVFSEFAKRKNIEVGLITDTRITHATPAGFYARSSSRNKEQDIAEQFLKSGVSFAFAGGKEYILSTEKGDPNFLSKAKESGYQIVQDKEQFSNLSSLPALALFGDSSMPDAIESKSNKEWPSLLEMTEKGIELFKDKKSYFLMIESGQIDWAAHQNDAGLLLHEMLRFESVLNYLLMYIKNNPSVTLMVLSDHETGGFGFSYKTLDSESKVDLDFKEYQTSKNFIPDVMFERLFSQKKSFLKISKQLNKIGYNFTKSKEVIVNELGLLPSDKFLSAILDLENKSKKTSLKNQFEEKHEFYSNEEEVDSVIISKYVSPTFGVAWSTGTHTTSLVPFVVEGDLKNSKFEKPLSLVEVGKLLRQMY
jgi:alkaline phosphatase